MLRNRKGFTLIELLIVVVIIGILAAIALPKFGQTRERAYISAMQSDLRNLQSVQEMHYADQNYTYLQAGTITDAASPANLDMRATNGVTLTLTDGGGQANSSGYGATAVHSAHPGYSCSMIVGGAGAAPISCAAGSP